MVSGVPLNSGPRTESHFSQVEEGTQTSKQSNWIPQRWALIRISVQLWGSLSLADVV